MKVYFDCSARGAKEHGEYYALIYRVIEELGHTHISDYRESLDLSQVVNSHDRNTKLFKSSMRSIDKCDVLVLEISTNSLTMGYLMQRALSAGKPVIALHLPGHYPLFAAGNEDEKLQVVEYSKDQITLSLRTALDYAAAQSDVRFNFFISPIIGQYLDWISRNKKIPRSVYLRNLIEEDMVKNPEYSAKEG